jgi:hypothetical protein
MPQRAPADVWLHTWSTGNLDIGVRANGWIDLRIAFPSPGALTAAGTPSAAFTPAEIMTWLDSARAFVQRTNPPVDSTRYGRFLARTLQLNIARSVNGARAGWTIYVEMCGTGGWSPPASEPPTELFAMLDSAATAARAASSQPARLPADTVVDATDAGCGDGPNGPMPVDSQRMRHGAVYMPPFETMAQFVVTKRGVLDTRSIEFDPPLTPAYHVSAMRMLAQWRVLGPPSIGGTPVDVRYHRVVRFIDPTDSADLMLGRERPRQTWIARRDGMLEWWNPTNRNEHEVFTPGEVSAWLDRISGLRARRGSPVSQLSPPPTDRFGQQALTSPWRDVLGSRDGSRVVATLYREGNDLVHFGLAGGICGHAPPYASEVDARADSSLTMAARSVAMATGFRPNPALDTTRVYGEIETTCPASRSGDAFRNATVDDSLRAALALPSEALVDFVVDRDGRVALRTVHVFGSWTANDRSRIGAATATLRYAPALFAGHRVAQRMHYLIPRRAPTGPGALDPVREVCVAGRGVSLRLNILVPEQGIARRDLAKIGSDMMQGYERAAAKGPFGASFRFVALPNGEAHFARWTVLPADTLWARQTLGATGLVPRLTARPSDPPLGIQVLIGERCD